jgi:hypothetical protein
MVFEVESLLRSMEVRDKWHSRWRGFYKAKWLASQQLLHLGNTIIAFVKLVQREGKVHTRGRRPKQEFSKSVFKTRDIFQLRRAPTTTSSTSAAALQDRKRKRIEQWRLWQAVLMNILIP